MKSPAAPSGPRHGEPQHDGPQHTESYPDEHTAAGPLARHRAPAQWAMLLCGSILSTVLLRWLSIPAALLLGPMVTRVMMGIQGATVRLPVTSFVAAQSIVGCLIAGVISGSILQTLVQAWPIHLGVVCAIVAISTLTGWTLSRLRVLPGSTAIWGTSPGAASAMMLMAEAFGADAQTVAFMQYLRVLLAASYALLGWNIGLGFTRRVLQHAWHALPPIVLSNLVLILCCGGLAWELTRVLGIEPLTAYLATSPGGIDSVAIIAASSRVAGRCTD